MIRKSRLLLAFGLVLALGASGVAIADMHDGASQNTSRVKGKVQPRKVPRQNLMNVNMFTQVTTEWDVPITTQQNPEEVYIDFGSNIRLRPNAAPTCSANISILTTQEAKAACPRRSNVGNGEAHARIPGFPTPENRVEDFRVIVFNGSSLPGPRRVRLHAYSPSLGVAPGNPAVVEGRIVKSPLGRRYAQRLSVPNAPDVADDAGGLVMFNATLRRGTGVVKARCDRPQRFFWRTRWVYDDGTADGHVKSRPCRRR